MIQEIFLETVKIIVIITALMVAVEWFQIRFKDRIERWLVKSPTTQIIGSSLLGAIPGCMDAFLIVSLYSHCLVGFGALAAVMLSTAGDEAFVMLAMVPEAALWIFAVCAILGIVGGFIAEKVAKRLGLERSKPCLIDIHDGESGVGHFRSFLLCWLCTL
jgi:uncharacterized membrane protein YfcA